MPKLSQNSEHKRSIRPGIPDVVLWKIAGVIQHEDGSLEIPYYDLDGNPIGYSRTRLPYVRANGQKYDQPKGSGVHVCLPPQLADLLDTNTGDVLPPGSCILVEGEFKAIALACARAPAIGLPGLYACKAIRDENGRTIDKEILDDLLTVIQVKKIKTLFFIGDADTSHNFLFSFEAWALAVAARKVGIEVYLPRLDVSGPKGIDDVRETFIDGGISFKEFFKKLIEDAVHLDPDKVGPQALARLLMEDQERGFAALAKTDDWPRIQTRLAKTCAWAQLCRHKDAENTQRLIASAGRISSLSTADFASEIKAQREHIQKRGQPDRDEPEAAEARPSAASETFSEQRSERERCKLSGRNLLDFLDMSIDPLTNLAGDRWLTVGSGGFLIAPSGHGKSSISVALAISFAIGRAIFGIKPARPLRIMLIQSEDDDADTKKFTQVVRKMNLTKEEMRLLAENTRFEHRNDLTGQRFIEALDDWLSEWPADIVIINPLTGFLLADLKDDEKVGIFLRQNLNAVLSKNQCAALIIHHTPKTNFTKLENMQWFDWMYAMAGCAALTNWARAVLVVAPSKIPGTYRFIAAKRFNEIQWTSREYWFSWSIEEFSNNGETYKIISWVPASDEQIKQAEPEKKVGRKEKNVTSAMLHEKMSPIEWMTRQQLYERADTVLHIGQKKVDDMVNDLVARDLVEVSHVKRPKMRDAVLYRKASDRNGTTEKQP
jgi:AAA domain/Domain of unknown function (DUF3854)